MAEKALQIAWISNIIFEPYMQACINGAFMPTGDSVLLNCVMYEEIDSNSEILKKADVVVVCLNFEELYPNLIAAVLKSDYKIDQICYDIKKNNLELLSLIKSISKAKIIWFGFENYLTNDHILFGSKYMLSGLIDIVNLSLSEILTDDVFVDFKKLIALCGICNSYNIKGKYRWNAPYSKELIKQMSDEVYKQYLIHTGQTKKCLVLDCDNVLWGGILSEDGIEGIKLSKGGLGKPYYDFQNFVLTMYQHGVILAVCSKNDEKDVMRVFREHSEIPLKEKHISCFMVNWENKPSNIERIAEYLKIGLDSIVFVDDSSIEIESVKSLLPEVTAIQFDKYMDYEPFSCFNLRTDYDIEEVEKRTQTYQTNGLRNELKNNSADYTEYVKSLSVVADIHKAIPAEFSRIAELTQRTNKCTNGKRYTVEDIKERDTLPNVSLYSVSVSDRFSDLGLVGAMEVENDRLTLFSLSCRALGREVEQIMIDYLATNHQIKSFDFISTNKNEKLQEVLKEIIKENTAQ